MSVTDLTDPIVPDAPAIALPHAQDWMQGRTLYGGASALLAYTHVTRSFPDLPPLRAAQIGFVAPLGAEMTIHSEIVRQGRNVAQLRTEIHADGKVALHAFWLFGTAREPNAVHPAPPPTPAPSAPEDGGNIATDGAPSFLSANYEVRHAGDRRPPGEPVVRRWARLKDHGTLNPVAELILLGDTLPPSAARIMQRRGPMSSINWSFNLLDPEPATREGWWLVETASDHADQGYSSERLRLWNAEGKQMLAGMQAVAIFG